MQQKEQRDWSKVYEQGRDFTLASSQEISRFLRYGHPAAPRTCLDIGCGTGQLSRELYHRGFKVVGIDSSEKAVEIARSLTTAPRHQLSYVRFDIERDNLATLPAIRYGLITCKLAIAFIADKETFLSRVAHLLGPRSLFVIVTPVIAEVPSERREIAVDQAATLHLLQNYFEVVVYHSNGQAYFVCALRGSPWFNLIGRSQPRRREGVGDWRQVANNQGSKISMSPWRVLAVMGKLIDLAFDRP